MLMRPAEALLWSPELPSELQKAMFSWFASNLGTAAYWGFAGIWALRELQASPSLVGAAYLVGAGLTAWAGYLGGPLADRLGHRAVMMASWGGQAVLITGCGFAGRNLWIGLALMVLSGAVGSPARTAFRTLVANAVDQQHHEAAFAVLRIVLNVAMTAGPAAAGVAIALAGWPWTFLGCAGLLAISAVVAARHLPPAGPVESRDVPRSAFRAIRRRPGLLPFALAALLASFGFVAVATVLPILAVGYYGLSEWQWGLLAAINPVLVVFAQLWLTRRAAAYPQRPKLVVGTLLMGLPFLVLTLETGIACLVVVIVVSVIGEMIWTPTSQALASRMAPATLRGAYLGLHGSMTSTAYAIGPFLALNVLDALGPRPIWVLFGVITVTAAVIGHRSAPAELDGARPG